MSSLPNLGALSLAFPTAPTAEFAEIKPDDAKAYWASFVEDKSKERCVEKAEREESEGEEYLEADEKKYGVRRIQDPCQIEDGGLPFDDERRAFRVSKVPGRDDKGYNWYDPKTLAQWVRRQIKDKKFPVVDPLRVVMSKDDIDALRNEFRNDKDLNIPKYDPATYIPGEQVDDDEQEEEEEEEEEELEEEELEDWFFMMRNEADEEGEEEEEEEEDGFGWFIEEDEADASGVIEHKNQPDVVSMGLRMDHDMNELFSANAGNYALMPRFIHYGRLSITFNIGKAQNEGLYSRLYKIFGNPEARNADNAMRARIDVEQRYESRFSGLALSALETSDLWNKLIWLQATSRTPQNHSAIHQRQAELMNSLRDLGGYRMRQAITPNRFIGPQLINLRFYCHLSSQTVRFTWSFWDLPSPFFFDMMMANRTSSQERPVAIMHKNPLREVINSFQGLFQEILWACDTQMLGPDALPPVYEAQNVPNNNAIEADDEGRMEEKKMTELLTSLDLKLLYHYQVQNRQPNTYFVPFATELDTEPPELSEPEGVPERRDVLQKLWLASNNGNRVYRL